jgi:phosphate acyltransferase
MPMSDTPVIAVDAMGGDYAPDEIVRGAVDALDAAPGELEIILVGREDEINASLASHGARHGLNVVHAPDVVSMGDSVSTLRRSKKTSLAVSLALQHEDRAHATVSAGNTAAAMALSMFTFGRIPGVSRPAISATVPTAIGMTTLLDAGANSVCKSENLLQFAVMGSLYHSKVFGVANPTIGLLSIGEEASKGDQVVQEAHTLLKASSLNFVGNIEGKDIFPGNVDVVVCDGFTGNVLLKFAESMPRFFGNILRDEINVSWVSKIGALLVSGAFKRMKQRLDWQEYGGAPLLGLDGVTIVCHGRSQARAIACAINVAAQAVRNGLNVEIKTELEKLHVESTT